MSELLKIAHSARQAAAQSGRVLVAQRGRRYAYALRWDEEGRPYVRLGRGAEQHRVYLAGVRRRSDGFEFWVEEREERV